MSRASFRYKAGAARVCITPDEPLWLAGYASRSKPAGGRISDLYASALALEDSEGQRFVIVSVDLIAITPTIAEPVIEASRRQFGLASKQLLLIATHTHYGPEFRSDKQVFFKIPAQYSEMFPSVASKLTESLVQVIGEALRSLQPARLVVHMTTANFAHNRRRHGIVAGTPSTDDVVDHDVPILGCVDASGNRIAVMFGYACHNTTIPPEDLRYSGDWAGFAKEHLEKTHPRATALFVPGAGADQDPEPSGSVELSRQHGLELADAVVQALGGSGLEVDGPIRTARTDVQLPLQRVTHALLHKMLDSNDPPQQVKAQFILDSLDRGARLLTSYSAPIQVAQFGDELLLIALSGEPVVDWSQSLKREFGQPELPNKPFIWVAGYCNDMFGYLPTRRIQSEGGYEGGRANLWSSIPAPFSDDVEVRVSNAVRQLVDQVKNKS